MCAICRLARPAPAERDHPDRGNARRPRSEPCRMHAGHRVRHPLATDSRLVESRDAEEAESQIREALKHAGQLGLVTNRTHEQRVSVLVPNPHSRKGMAYQIPQVPPHLEPVCPISAHALTLAYLVPRSRECASITWVIALPPTGPAPPPWRPHPRANPRRAFDRRRECASARCWERGTASRRSRALRGRSTGA